MLESRGSWALSAFTLWLASTAQAQVVEPNGLTVPGPSSETGETSLAEFFAAEGEAIDPVASASAQPGVFSPLCDFAAALVLSESGASAGIAWYNVPTDPNEIPSEFYPLVSETDALGAVVGSNDIRDNPAYQGGQIGFVLTREDRAPETAIYYSEYLRNPECTECTPAGHWIMSLVFPSTLDPNTFYLAFEDWPGADSASWQGNDGDFNDKVFRINGVVCLGGGEPCVVPDQVGVCANGLTECRPGGDLACRPQIPASDEVCDNIDNNCDGEIDNAPELCPEREACVEGRCIPACDTGEFRCQPGYQCVTGVCVEQACIGVSCDEGYVCRGGACAGGCEGVVCPLGQFCQPTLGTCIDPCEHADCGVNETCKGGVCVVSCTCTGCEAGKLCEPTSGACVDAGCEALSCPEGERCQGGACVDACAGASCPGGATCVLGRCGEPVDDAPAAGGTDGGLVIDLGPGTGPSSGGVSGEQPGTAAGGAVSGASPSADSGASDKGCACRAAGSGSGSHAPAGFALLGLAWAASRRRRPRVGFIRKPRRRTLRSR